MRILLTGTPHIYNGSATYSKDYQYLLQTKSFELFPNCSMAVDGDTKEFRLFFYFVFLV
jgi:hypothetical protein